MAARDRFTIDLECPSCGRSGVANASEEDYPFMRNPGFQYDVLPEAFTVQQYDSNRNQTVLVCECGKEFTG